ncbi:MAG: hypothetical protein CMJ18_01405 [Phycisphaeraceae bacterium]|nr:hypothetical protein [Phycisphaeraceae bacterium]
MGRRGIAPRALNICALHDFPHSPRLMPMSAPPPVALITGAGSGIGRAAALRLGASNYRVALVGRTASKLEQTASEVDASAETASFTCDIGDLEQCGPLVTQVRERFGRIDALLNVAGAAPLLPIAEITPELIRSAVDTNLSGVMMLTAAAWPVMKAQGEGIIVNVSSLASIDPFPGFAMYAASKCGLNMFTRCTADEGAAHGIQAVGIAPGAVETPMLRSIFDASKIPPSKTLSPDDVAAVICDCVTGAGSFEAGETIQFPSP